MCSCQSRAYNTIEAICTYIQDVSNSAAFEFLKKASSIALIRRSLELKQIICLMLQDILTNMGYISEKSYLKESCH